jgi:hypothetical protein
MRFAGQRPAPQFLNRSALGAFASTVDLWRRIETMSKKKEGKLLQFPVKPAAAKPEYRPDPCNGSVYATEAFACIFVNGEIIKTPAGFIFVWMRGNGDPGDEGNHFDTLEQAQQAGREYAVARNAVYLP